MTIKDAESRLENRPLTSEKPVPRLYSMLSSDRNLLKSLAKKFDRKGARVKDCEVVRAALIALDKMNEEDWVDILSNLPKCAGRWGPKKKSTQGSKKTENKSK
jgi:hypothetical protein